MADLSERIRNLPARLSQQESRGRNGGEIRSGAWSAQRRLAIPTERGPPPNLEMRTRSRSEFRLHGCAAQRYDGIRIRTAVPPHPVRSVNELANRDRAADGGRRPRVESHERRIEQIEEALSLPRTAQRTIGACNPFRLRRTRIELRDVGEFFPAPQQSRFRSAFCFPF